MKTNLVIACICLIVGIALGSVLAPKLQSLVKQQELASLTKQTNVSFDRCAGLDTKASISCADSIVIEEALRKQDRTLCASIHDESVQKDCTARVDRLIALGDLSAWCKGSVSGVCVDVAAVLFAVEARDLSKCSTITVPSLLQACSVLISGKGEVDTGSTARQIVSAYQFGFQCDMTNKDCLSDKRTMNAAVKSGDKSLCDEFRPNKDFCLQELATYAAFTSGKTTACQSSPNEAMCQYDAMLAKALETSDPKLCASLDAKAVAGCQEFVKITKEKRFDYLNQAL